MRNNNSLFDILTLSSRNYQRLADPISIITGAIGILSNVFPNIFGGNRKRLTDADWLQLIPGSGFWTTKLREYLKARIHYDVDFERNIRPFTIQFAADNNAAICPKTYTFQNPPGTNPGGGGEAGWIPCYTTLLNLIKQETQTGGNSPIGQTPGGFGGSIDYSALAPIAIGAVALILVMNSRKKKR